MGRARRRRPCAVCTRVPAMSSLGLLCGRPVGVGGVQQHGSRRSVAAPPRGPCVPCALPRQQPGLTSSAGLGLPAAPRQQQRGLCVQAATAAPPASPSLLPWQACMDDVKKRRDIKKIMIIGAGPIVIGQVGGRARGCCTGSVFVHLPSRWPTPRPAPQACEFDYSGTQAVKALL